MARHLNLEPYEETTELWSDYSERLSESLLSMAITDDRAKVATLISAIGKDAYKRLKSLALPDKPSDKTFDELIGLMGNYYQPRPLTVVERFKFNKRDQREGESVNCFIAELRTLATFCDYGTTLDDQLRDRIVCGLRSEAIRKRLFTEANLTLDKTIQIAVSMETADKNLRVVKPQADKSGFNYPVHKLTGNRIKGGSARSNGYSHGGARGGPRFGSKGPSVPEGSGSKWSCGAGSGTKNSAAGRYCTRCGKNNHYQDKCKFANAKCYNCGKLGHLSKVCRKRDSKAHRVESDHESDPGEACYHVSEHQRKAPAPVIVHPQIDDATVEMELDCGTGHSLMSRRQWEQLFAHRPLNHTLIRLSSYNGNMHVMGECMVKVQYSGQTKTLPIIIVQEDGPALFGRDWLDAIILEWSEIKAKCYNIRGSASLNALLAKNKGLFNAALGTVKGVPIHITLKADATPKFCNARPIPFALRDKVDATLQQLEDDGILEPIMQSDWASPIVPVVKPDGTVRLCGDFKITVNGQLATDKYPLPRIEVILNEMANGKTFTKLDMARAYNQLMLDDESQKLCVINTPRGLRRHTRLPFGVSSAPALFQRRMDQLLVGLKGVVCFLNDICVTGRTESEHLRNLEAVFQRMAENGAKLNMAKCEFMQKNIKFLGHVLSEQGITALPNKLDAVQKMQRPTNKSELKSFASKINYYRKFVPNQATLLEPLNDLLKKNVPWAWSAQCETNFQHLKNALISPKLLLHYDPNLPVTLACDASPVGVGAVLSHILPNGDERPIAFASETLNETRRRYSQIEKEAYAIIFGVRKFYQYLFGKRFTLITDHKPLTAIFGPKRGIPVLAVSRLQRWAILLSSYQYDIEFRGTNQHANADALSRLPLAETSDLHDTSTTEDEIDTVLVNYVRNLPISATEIAEASTSDVLLSQVMQFVETGWPGKDHLSSKELWPFWHRQDELIISNGCLFWQHRIVIPSNLQASILAEFHKSHPGITRMKMLVRQHIWWPGLDAAVEGIVRECQNCNENRSMPPSVVKQSSWEKSTRPWQRVNIDHAGPFLGHYWFLVVDAFTRWPEICRVRSSNVNEVITFLRRIFSQFGIPEEIVSNNGSAFISSEFKTYCEQNGICHTPTAPYHPTSNGLAERLVQTFKNGMKMGQSTNLELKVNQFLLQYRITPNAESRVSPGELMFGRPIQTCYNLLKRPRIPQKSTAPILTSGSFVWARNYREGKKNGYEAGLLAI